MPDWLGRGGMNGLSRSVLKLCDCGESAALTDTNNNMEICMVDMNVVKNGCTVRLASGGLVLVKGCTFLSNTKKYQIKFETNEQIQYEPDGKRIGGRGSLVDIVEVLQPKKPKKGKLFVNVYPNGTHGTFKTKEEADELAGPDRIACAKVEWVEGDGIDKGAVAKVRKKRGRPRKEVK